MEYDAATMSPPPVKGRTFGRRRRFGDRIFSNLTLIFALVIVAILLGLVIVLNIEAAPSISKFGISFLGSSSWDVPKESFGALPAIYGTLLTSAIGVLIAVPISLGAAIFLVEMAPSWLRGPCSFLIEMLAAIPSVIIGLWGIYVLAPFMTPIERWLGGHLGFIPIFHGQVFGFSFLTAGVILTLMIIPIITAVSRDAIKAVPDHQREAMLALGATRWETIRRAVLPYCRSGLIGATILGLGRALGETMAVTMVIGNAYKLTPSLFSTGTTISSKIANEFGEASSGLFIASLVELALVLFGVTLLINVVARLLVWRLTAVKEAS